MKNRYLRGNSYGSVLLGLFTAAGLLAQTPVQVNTGREPFVRMVKHNDGSRTVTSRDFEKDRDEQVLKTYDVNGELKLVRVYLLDRYGRYRSFVIYDGQERPLLKGEYGFDHQDRLIEERLTELPSGELIRVMRQEYGPNGKKLPPENRYLKPLPPEIMHWMDPDSRGEGDPMKKTMKVPLFNRNKAQDKAAAAKKKEGSLFKKLRFWEK